MTVEKIVFPGPIIQFRTESSNNASEHHILGRCLARNIKVGGDWCNNQCKGIGDYCSYHTCIVHDCENEASVWYILLKDCPRFCSEHLDKPTKKWKQLISVSNEPKDYYHHQEG